MLDQNQLWWMDHVWKGLQLLVPVMIMLVQLQRNHSYALKAQTEQLKRQMSLEIYKELSEAWLKAVNQCNEFFARVNSLQRWVELRSTPAFQVIEPPLTVDPVDANNAMTDASRALVQLSYVLEKWEVALPGFDHMRVAIIEQHQAVVDGYRQLWDTYVMYIPQKGLRESHSEVRWEAPPPDLVLSLKQRYSDWLEQYSDLLAFMVDLRVSLQNHLVGPFFGNEVPLRTPTNPAYRVLSPIPPHPKRRWWQRKA
jgi:hypothetical protein